MLNADTCILGAIFSNPSYGTVDYSVMDVYPLEIPMSNASNPYISLFSFSQVFPQPEGTGGTAPDQGSVLVHLALLLPVFGPPICAGGTGGWQTGVGASCLFCSQGYLS